MKATRVHLVIIHAIPMPQDTALVKSIATGSQDAAQVAQQQQGLDSGLLHFLAMQHTIRSEMSIAFQQISNDVQSKYVSLNLISVHRLRITVLENEAARDKVVLKQLSEQNAALAGEKIVLAEANAALAGEKIVLVEANAALAGEKIVLAEANAALARQKVMTSQYMEQQQIFLTQFANGIQHTV